MVLSLPRLAGEKIITGGLDENTLKKLNGAKFGTPSSLMVLAKAIGLGLTAVNKYPCNSGTLKSEGEKLVVMTRTMKK